MSLTIKLLVAIFLFLQQSSSFSATIQPGALIISEVMANPLASNDTNGEWFEIFNPTANTIDLNGVTINDNGSNSHLINNGASLFIESGAYLVLGRSGDTSVNGGYIADYVYNNFTLNNSSDQIILSKDSIEITRLEYTGLPFGMAGVSTELFIQSFMPSSTDYQLSQNTPYGLGDIGTPGSAGSIELTVANPVPLPSGLWLFLSGIILLLRKNKVSWQCYLQQHLPSLKKSF
jgi:hypothetical protein